MAIQNSSNINKRIIIYQMMTRLFGNTNSTNKIWGTIEENGVGKFDDISELALSKLYQKGYTHIWYTGVIEHAVLTDYTAYGIPLDDADVVKGRAGSPYAIKDYYDVNPDLAINVNNRMTEFESLIKRTHGTGLKVIIDFVPNHVARAYRSDKKPDGIEDFGSSDNPKVAFDPANNYYYILGSSFSSPENYNSLGNNEFPTKNKGFNETPAKVSGNDVFSASPSIYDWFETTKLNYGVDIKNEGKKHFDPIPNTWLKMKDILLYWAAKGVDGFRCDMAEMVPVEFWNWAIREVKLTYPNVIFIAEIYNPNAYRDYILNGGFDYLYDKVEMYDTLKRIIQGTGTTDDLTSVWQNQEGIENYMLRFLENHDEQRLASEFFAGDMEKGIPLMALSAFMHKGPVMMYMGQDVGEPGKGESGFGGDDGRTTIFDYWGIPEHIKWVNNGMYDGGLLSDKQKELQKRYSEILMNCNEYRALREGEFYDLHFYNRNNEYECYSNKVFTFLRYSKDEVLLIAVNLSAEDQRITIKIPEDAWNTMNFSSENISFNDKTISRSSTIDYSVKSELEITIEKFDYLILQLKQISE